MNRFFECNLQLFNDGGGTSAMGGAVAQGSTAQAVDSGQVAADNGVNATDNSTQSDAELEANYKAMISGEYKAVHEKYFEKQMSRRLKGKDKQIAEMETYKGQVSPLLDKLAIKYGVADPSNIEAIMQAADADNSYYEEYAMQHGVDIDTAKQLIRAERITADNERRLQEEREMAAFQERYNGWMQQAAETQQYYPDFDFDYEVNNEMTGDDFKRLLNADVPVKMAYEVVHQGEVMGGAMQYAYQTAKKEMADERTARSARPRENGTSSQQASAVQDNMSALTKKQVEKLHDAVRNGVKIDEHNFRNYL